MLLYTLDVAKLSRIPEQIFSCSVSGELLHTEYCSVLPPSPNISHSRVFRTNYGCVEKTLLPLIIKHWNSVYALSHAPAPYAPPLIWVHARLSIGKDPKTMHN